MRTQWLIRTRRANRSVLLFWKFQWYLPKRAKNQSDSIVGSITRVSSVALPRESHLYFSQWWRNANEHMMHHTNNMNLKYWSNNNYFSRKYLIKKHWPIAETVKGLLGWSDRPFQIFQLVTTSPCKVTCDRLKDSSLTCMCPLAFNSLAPWKFEWHFWSWIFQIVSIMSNRWELYDPPNKLTICFNQNWRNTNKTETKCN